MKERTYNVGVGGFRFCPDHVRCDVKVVSRQSLAAQYYTAYLHDWTLTLCRGGTDPREPHPTVAIIDLPAEQRTWGMRTSELQSWIADAINNGWLEVGDL